LLPVKPAHAGVRHRSHGARSDRLRRRPRRDLRSRV